MPPPSAHYRLETQIIGRRAKDRSGKVIAGKQVSIVAKAAYRSGQALSDERSGKSFNYRSRADEVAHSEIMAPADAAGWLRAENGNGGPGTTRGKELRERLWNTIEKVEKRSDSQLAREFIISLPVQLKREDQIEAVRAWCNSELVSKGLVVDFSLHQSKKKNNPHAHILATLRPVEGEGFGKKPDMAGKFNGRGAAGLSAKNDLIEWRDSWEKRVNAALERAGREERADRRSLKDRGLDRLPEPKVGVTATAMKRKGAWNDPLRFAERRRIKLLNEVLPHLRDVLKRGELGEQDGHSLVGRTLQRVKSAGRVAADRVKDFWQRYLDSRRTDDRQKEELEPSI